MTLTLQAIAMSEDDWRIRALCRGVDPDTWFPRKGDLATRTTARRICHACPVRRECAELAFNIGAADGIWGGLSPKQRTAIRNRRRGT